jgi:hypothetical protein
MSPSGEEKHLFDTDCTGYTDFRVIFFTTIFFVFRGDGYYVFFYRSLTDRGYSTALKSSKYLSLLNPMIRMLFFITNTGTSLYLGITTGRIAPGK